jgi:hypothetical protein
MSKAYNITLVFVAEDDAEAEEIRADLIDYLLRYNVGQLAEVLPIKRES